MQKGRERSDPRVVHFLFSDLSECELKDRGWGLGVTVRSDPRVVLCLFSDLFELQEEGEGDSKE